MEKACTKCGVTKPGSDFFKRARAKDGLRSECKTCTAAANKDYGKRNPEILEKAHRDWIARNPEKRRQIKRNWNASNKPAVARMNERQADKRRAAAAEHRAQFPRLYRADGKRKTPRELIAMAFPTTSKDRQVWYRNNAPKLRAKVAKWAAANKEKLREKDRVYGQRNRAKRQAKHAAYRAKKKQAIPAWADGETIRLFYELARALTHSTGIPHHVDHIVPLNSPEVQGFHVAENLCVLTGPENSAKGNRHWPDMWGEQPELFE